MSYQDFVIKRNGEKEVVSFDKILKRVTLLGKNTLEINYTSLVKKIIDMLYDEIPTDRSRWVCHLPSRTRNCSWCQGQCRQPCPSVATS